MVKLDLGKNMTPEVGWETILLNISWFRGSSEEIRIQRFHLL